MEKPLSAQPTIKIVNIEYCGSGSGAIVISFIGIRPAKMLIVAKTSHMHAMVPIWYMQHIHKTKYNLKKLEVYIFSIMYEGSIGHAVKGYPFLFMVWYSLLIFIEAGGYDTGPTVLSNDDVRLLKCA